MTIAAILVTMRSRARLMTARSHISPGHGMGRLLSPSGELSWR
jgi:hypothetical protein